MYWVIKAVVIFVFQNSLQVETFESQNQIPYPIKS